VFAGDPVEVLREQTADPDTGLLVVGSRGHTSWHALGSVSRALAATADVPVMVVPPSTEARSDTGLAGAAQLVP
jgi:nucleotide-binding universal stress UspA family protein